MSKLDDDIIVQGEPVPHIIINIGDVQIYLLNKGYDHSIEPLENSNDDYIYNVVPRCIVTPHGINFETDQTSNPYSNGEFQYQTSDNLYTFTAEFRRLPIKLSVELKYYVSTYTNLLELMQQICTKLCWIKTYNIVYMGQNITCSYKVTDQLEGEYLTELDGTTQDNRNKVLTIDLEVETNIPVYSPGTIIYNGGTSIKNTVSGLIVKSTDGCITDVVKKIIKSN